MAKQIEFNSDNGIISEEIKTYKGFKISEIIKVLQSLLKLYFYIFKLRIIYLVCKINKKEFRSIA